MAAAEPYKGVGSNRKIRRRPLRRAAETPYDRPAAAIQGLRIQSAAAVAERNGWISKAMRIIEKSASRIFPSVFQTPLPPPPEAAGMTDPCTDENHHSCKGFSEIACTVSDMSLVDYIAISPGKHATYLPHTAGWYSVKRFRKAQCHIIERLTNSLMMHGRNNGKKLMAVCIIKHAMEIIHLLTDLNPIQVIVDAVINRSRGYRCSLGAAVGSSFIHQRGGF